MNDSAGPVIIQPVELLHDREFLVRNEGHPFCLSLRLKFLIASVYEWDQLPEYSTWNLSLLGQQTLQTCFRAAASQVGAGPV